MNSTLVSVVVPTCRRPDLLARCLDCLAPGVQTLAANRYEVIVSDDGEPTAERVVAERYPWASWILGPRRGPAANRNAGARRARGEWLAFTDDDCVPDSGWLSGLLAAVHDGCRVYEGRTTCVAGCRSPLDQTPANPTGGYLWSCNIFIRRTTFEAVGRFDEAFPYPHMEDVDLRERLARAGEGFEFVPAAVVDHPPRPMASGWRLGRSHESWVYFWYKSGQRGSALPRLMYELFRLRLFRVWEFPLSIDTFRAMGAFAAEVGVVLAQGPGWERKYRRRFLSPAR